MFGCECVFAIQSTLNCTFFIVFGSFWPCANDTMPNFVFSLKSFWCCNIHFYCVWTKNKGKNSTKTKGDILLCEIGNNPIKKTLFLYFFFGIGIGMFLELKREQKKNKKKNNLCAIGFVHNMIVFISMNKNIFFPSFQVSNIFAFIYFFLLCFHFNKVNTIFWSDNENVKCFLYRINI